MSTDPRPSLSNTKRAALFALHGGVCHICSQKIDGPRERWEVEHIIPRSMIGKHADTDENMQPAHIACHKVKTAQDRKNLAKSDRNRGRHQGTHKAKTPMPFGRDDHRKRKMDGTIVDRRTGELWRGSK